MATATGHAFRDAVVWPSGSVQSGEKIGFECVQSNGEWGPAPVCQQTGQPMQLVVGQDGRYSCAWLLDASQYAYLRELLETERGWKCRISMANDENSFRIPFMLPVWGVAEAAHIHLDNHINMLFHMEDGWIVGATAYPTSNRCKFAAVREPLELATESGQLHIHGSMRWFRSHSFDPLNPTVSLDLLTDSSSALGRFVMASPLFAGVLTAMATCLVLTIVFVAIFRCYLTPRIVHSVQVKATPGPAESRGAGAAASAAAAELD